VAAVAEELPRLSPDQPEEYVRAAAFLARCLPPLAGDAPLPRESRDTYERRAVELLQQAIQKGYQGPALEGPWFAPLGHRPDFQQLRDEARQQRRRVAG
jgi:hypothetical protein